jgi:hypothetical protein
MAINGTFRAIACVFFLTHIPATIMMDSQAIFPPAVVPGFAKAGRVSDWSHGPYRLSPTGVFDRTPC